MSMSGGLVFSEDIERSDLDYFADTARSIEVVREENDQGRYGSFGFTLIQEKPPQVGTVVPGGPAEKAGLSKGDIVLAVNGQDITRMTHQQVTDLIRTTKTRGVWLSVCEGDGMSNSRSNSLGRSSNLQYSYSPSTPLLIGTPIDIPQKRLHDPISHRRSLGSRGGPMYGTNDSLHTSPTKPLSLSSNKGHLYATTDSLHTSPTKVYSSSASSLSPLARKAMTQQSDSEYVALVPAPPVYTRISILLHYVGPVKIPESWSARGVSSRCIQECARQLLSVRQPKDFLKVQLEVQQRSLRITNIQSNILAKHRRDELYYCGLCTNDEQYFAVVTKNSASSPGGSKSQNADLCHIFKLLPDSRLSTYCIDRKKSNREMKSGPEVSVKSCTNIINAIQSVFQSEAAQQRLELALTSSGDTSEYGVVRGVSTFHLQSTENGYGDNNDSVSSHSTYSSSPSSSSTSSPQVSRKKLNVIDLRPQGKSSPPRRHQRSGSNPSFNTSPGDKTAFAPSSLAIHSSMGVVGNGLHVRMGSGDGGNSSSNHSLSSYSKTYQAPARKKSFQVDGAQHVSDSSLSSYSSDHSGQRSGSNSPSPTKSIKRMTTSPAHAKPSVDVSPQRVKRISQGRRPSNGLRAGAMSPTYDAATLSSRGLRRQNSETSLFDLTGAGFQMSPYHHYGLPPKNSGHTASMDSIITVTTLAGEDDAVDSNGASVGRVAGWCASFDKLLADPLGVECLLEFLETEHSQENILFWREAQEYKTSSPANLQAAAKMIYDTYLSVSAPQQINIDDRVLKDVEASLNNPTVHIFVEAQNQVYQLVKLDCHPRFVKSQLVKDCLCAEMAGNSLPIRMSEPTTATSESPKPKKTNKTMSHSNSLTRSLFSRIRGPQPPSPTENRRSSKKEKKDKAPKEESTKKHQTEAPATSEQDNLNMLQVHRKNLCEVNLPNRVTKIIEVPSTGTVRTAVANVLKRYSYSLDVMEVMNASTLQPVDLDTNASVLVGKHISVTRSKNTVTVTFPDLAEAILPANGASSLRDMFDNFLTNHSKENSYSVFLEGARAALELDLDTSILAGYTVTVKYVNSPPGPTVSIPPKKGKQGKGGAADLSSSSGSSLSSNSSKSSKGSKGSKLSEGVEELFSMIERLNVDTLEDQRMPDRYSPDSPKESPPKKSSPRFSRTKSGPSISNKKKLVLRRSHSPNPSSSHSQQDLDQPPSPSSEPPTLRLAVPFNAGATHHLDPNISHRRQTSADRLSGISTGSGSSVDSISHELAIADQRQIARHQLREWISSKAAGQEAQPAAGMPNYFPDAFGSGTLDRGSGHQQLGPASSVPLQHPGHQMGSIDHGRSSSFSRGYHTMQPQRAPHPLDNIVNEAYITQKKGTWPPSQAAQQQMEYDRQVGIQPSGNAVPVSSYPWRYAHNQQVMRPSTVDDSQQFSDSGSMASSLSGSNGPTSRTRLSPTTHVLVVEDQTHETFV